MARVFNGTTQHLTRSSSPVTALPITMACWYYNASDTGATEHFMTIASSGAGAEWISLMARWATANNPAGAFMNAGGTNPVADTSTFLSTSTWHHIAGTYTTSGGNITATALLNGGGKVSSTQLIQSFTAANWDRLSCGGAQDSSPSYGAGTLAWPCWWNVALTDDEILTLAKGAHPYTVRPASIIEFVPLGENTTGNVVSPITGVTFTATNAPTYADSLPVTLGGAQIVQFTPVAGGTAVPIFHRHYANLRTA